MKDKNEEDVKKIVRKIRNAHPSRKKQITNKIIFSDTYHFSCLQQMSINCHKICLCFLSLLLLLPSSQSLSAFDSIHNSKNQKSEEITEKHFRNNRFCG
jgi:hypothetical protein